MPHTHTQTHARQQDAQVKRLWDLVFIKSLTSEPKLCPQGIWPIICVCAHVFVWFCEFCEHVPVCLCYSVGWESQTKESFYPQPVHLLYPFIKALVLIFLIPVCVCVCVWMKTKNTFFLFFLPCICFMCGQSRKANSSQTSQVLCSPSDLTYSQQ